MRTKTISYIALTVMLVTHILLFVTAIDPLVGVFWAVLIAVDLLLISALDYT